MRLGLTPKNLIGLLMEYDLCMGAIGTSQTYFIIFENNFLFQFSNINTLLIGIWTDLLRAVKLYW